MDRHDHNRLHRCAQVIWPQAGDLLVGHPDQCTTLGWGDAALVRS